MNCCCCISHEHTKKYMWGCKCPLLVWHRVTNVYTYTYIWKCTTRRKNRHLGQFLTSRVSRNIHIVVCASSLPFWEHWIFIRFMHKGNHVLTVHECFLCAFLFSQCQKNQHAMRVRACVCYLCMYSDTSNMDPKAHKTIQEVASTSHEHIEYSPN
jgi:hypothetical protein